MKYGFIKVAAITPQVEVADCPHNARAIAKGMEQAYRGIPRTITDRIHLWRSVSTG